VVAAEEYPHLRLVVEVEAVVLAAAEAVVTAAAVCAAQRGPEPDRQLDASAELI
jgi:hypothetical protein